jgi:hypothetical protein
MAVGLVLVALGAPWPNTLGSWILISVLAPVVYFAGLVLAEIADLILTKISFVARFRRAVGDWIDRGVDSGDRVLRLCVVFVVPILLAFLLAWIWLVPWN